MGLNAQIITGQKKYPSKKLGRQSLLTACFLFIFLMSFFSPPFQTPASADSVPTLLLPANGVTITATGSGANAKPPVAMPVFSWTAIDSATYYRIQFSPNYEFTIIYEYTTPLTQFIPPSVDVFNDGLWYWRVRVDSPVAGFYSSAKSFTKQWSSLDNKSALVSPANGQTIEFYDQPVFSWQPVIGAASYKFQIATSSDFSFSTLVYNQDVVATTHQPSYKLANGTYYWRVVPVDPIGRQGTPSNVRSFVMGYNRVPTLLEPANHSHPTFTPTFRWTAVRGANAYRLDYSTNSDVSNPITIFTPNTTFTPSTTLPNDKNYYWRVRAISGVSQSDWSPTWDFLKQWYIVPVLLTPTNNFTHVRLPFFSWTPVPGANYYQIELDTNTSFLFPVIVDITSNTFYTPYKYAVNWNTVYWRVIPFDLEGFRGKESSVSSYNSYPDQITPEQIYPFYYYHPNTFPSPFDTVSMNPAADRTVTWPIFTWGRLTDLNGVTVATAYRVQVATSPTFYNIVWSIDTQTTNAVPTVGNSFVPTPGQDYFWRVHGLSGSPGSYGLTGNWSQTWQTRFSLAPSSTPTPTPPQLLRPLSGAEIVETTPLLEWLPVSGADSYEVQISDDPLSFASPVDSGMASYPAYAPVTSLAQRSLGLIKFGTFYWHVRARSGGNPLGGWSETRRFQIAAQGQRVESRSLGNSSNRFLIASDPVDAADKKYELTSLNASQSADYWFFGFNTTITATNVTYALYLDLDHQDNSGAVSDPRGYLASTLAAHRPEFVIYVDKVGSSFSTDTTILYSWNKTSWDPPRLFTDIGGHIYFDAATGYVEIQVPNTAILMGNNTFSLTLALFSAALSGGQVFDSVPSNPTIPGSGLINRLASVSERMNIIYPAYAPDNDPNTYSTIPPFFADYPTGSNGNTPWTGARLKVYIDPNFTTEIASYDVTSDIPYYSPISHAWPDDFTGDNTYYWRIQPCYTVQRFCGAWNQTGRLERVGFVPQHLQESVTFATPTFSWDLVEGAFRYQLQVTQNNFASPLIDIQTDLASYTYPATLPNGTYYWRVRTIRFHNPTSEWSSVRTFTLTLPVPTNLTPNNPDPAQAIHTIPTLCWQPINSYANGVPVLTAFRYIVQVSLGDSSFSNILQQIETEQNCWTPTIGYDDGVYYWRVAMEDGNNRVGDFSAAATFVKQYPAAKPLSPVNGTIVSGTPAFSWTAADGITPYVFGAARYRLQISQFPTFSPLYEQIDTNETIYTPAHPYEIKKTYYWRVAIMDRDGKVGPYSDAQLTIDPSVRKVYIPLALRQ